MNIFASNFCNLFNIYAPLQKTTFFQKAFTALLHVILSILSVTPSIFDFF